MTEGLGNLCYWIQEGLGPLSDFNYHLHADVTRCSIRNDWSDVNAAIIWLEVGYGLTINLSLFDSTDKFAVGGLGNFNHFTFLTLAWNLLLEFNHYNVAIKRKAEVFSFNNNIFSVVWMVYKTSSFTTDHNWSLKIRSFYHCPLRITHTNYYKF